MTDITLVWKDQRLEVVGEADDRVFATDKPCMFDTSNPCLQVNDRRSGATIYRRRDGAASGHDYLVQVRLPERSYDVYATKKSDAIDAMYHFLPLMEFGMAKSMGAVLRAKRIAEGRTSGIMSSSGFAKWAARHGRPAGKTCA